MGILRIPQIPQYGVLLEKTYGKKDSLFHDVYKSAAKNVCDIINSQSTQKTEYFCNPCIAFVGKRGTGKSSAMMSFSNYLESMNSQNSKWLENEKLERLLNDAHFYVLPPVDTADMGDKETIVADVSAEMYTKFCELTCSVPVEKKRTFMENAKRTNDSAILKSFGNWEDLGDSLLGETEKVVHIKKSFENMVENFLSIVYPEQPKEKCYLVIQIDDLDMNISNSYRIMEEIRSIFSVKNVIVLLSVDIEQLKNVLKIHFENSFSTKSIPNRSVKKSSKDLSYKYIEKLLPAARRHYMPELTTEQLSTHISENFLGDDDINWERIGLFGINENQKKPTVMNAVMHLIWRKTMLIPMRNEYGDYILLPHNLRSLCNFIVFLRGMKDAAYDIDEIENDIFSPLTYFDFADEKKGSIYRNILEQNLRMFNQYIISNLETCERPEMNLEDETLSEILLNLIESLSDVNITELNSKLVGDIIRRIAAMESSCYFAWFNEDKGIEALLEATRYRDTVSMGDVMYVLGKIDKKTHCSYIRYLVQVIRTLWSVRMTMEIYVVGCNPQNKNDCEPETKFITRAFRDTVGAMIINPDTTETFQLIGKRHRRDWAYCINKNHQTIYDIVLPKDGNSITVANDGTINLKRWRVHLTNGEPVYRGHYEKKQNYCLSHPIALFSNLLYPYLIKKDIEDNEPPFSLWQEIFIMVFPFYSMDYMCRLYEKYISEVRRVSLAKVDSIMSFVIKHFSFASEQLWEEIKHYIPYIKNPNENLISKLPSIPAINESPQKNPHYLFGAPIDTLSIIKDWRTELVRVNRPLLDKINNIISKTKKSEKYPDNIDHNYVRSLYSCLSSELPKSITELPEYKIESFDDATSALEKLTSLIDAIEGKSNFVPFYFTDESVNPPPPSTRQKRGSEKKEKTE